MPMYIRIFIEVGSRQTVSHLTGHAYDKELKYWKIEYGVGDNPTEWSEYSQDYSNLLRKDENGNPNMNPILDEYIQRYADNDLKWLVGKKFRMVAEDFAGNKSISVSEFLEEKIIFDAWDNTKFTFLRYLGGIIMASFQIGPEHINSAVHKIKAIETLRTSLIDIKLQYQDASSGNWYDTSAVATEESDGIHFEWDTSKFSDNNVSAFRIKAIDSNGQDHYSNTLAYSRSFFIQPCLKAGIIDLPEPLESLEIMISPESKTPIWSTYKTLDVKNGDDIPQKGYVSILPVPDYADAGGQYFIRMQGVGKTGNIYISNVIEYPVDQGSCVKLPPYFLNLKLRILPIINAIAKLI